MSGLDPERIAARRAAIELAVYGMEGDFDKAELIDEVVWRGGGSKDALKNHVNLVVNELHGKGELRLVAGRDGVKGKRYRLAPDGDEPDIEGHNCTKCWVPPRHDIISSLSKLYGQEVTREQAQKFASTFCPKNPDRSGGTDVL